MRTALTVLMMLVAVTCHAQFRPASLNYGVGGFNDGSMVLYHPIQPHDGSGTGQRRDYQLFKPDGASTWSAGTWVNTFTNAVGGNLNIRFPTVSNYKHNTAAVSISMWIKPTTLAAATSYTLAAKADATITARCFTLYLYENILAFHTFGANGSTAGYATTGALNNWSHVVATYSAADGSKVYWNGALVDSKAASAVDLTNTANELWIGLERNSTGPFKGRMDNIRIYSRVITATEVSQIYALEYNHPRE